MLTSVLLTKLPPEVRLIATRKSSGDLDLETLQTIFEEDIFEEELIARERSPRINSRHPQDRMRAPPTATTLIAGVRESSKGSVGTCCYCQQSHLAVDCHVVTNLDELRRNLKTYALTVSGRDTLSVVRLLNASQTCRRKHHCDQHKMANPL